MYSFVRHIAKGEKMSYRELIGNGADKTAIQTYLSQGDMHSTTIRIPDNLRDAAAEEAKLSGVSFSAYIRMCLVEKLSSERSAK
ncbi:YlcI/YnfO family protein [Gordonibacter sp. Marseille-P4307]|uniref:YlcI/YnfO family protein n=1 Tax=Gordonibacter sp. Marseille-P4307 TaxID=2161815 RepID=UPI000F51DA48